MSHSAQVETNLGELVLILNIDLIYCLGVGPESSSSAASIGYSICCHKFLDRTNVTSVYVSNVDLSGSYSIDGFDKFRNLVGFHRTNGSLSSNFALQTNRVRISYGTTMPVRILIVMYIFSCHMLIFMLLVFFGISQTNWIWLEWSTNIDSRSTQTLQFE